jgi:WD40 repeat protein
MASVQSKTVVVRLLIAFLTVAFWGWPSERAAADTPELVLKGHKGESLCVAFSPDGKTIATGGADGKVRLWEVATAKETAAFDAGPAHAVGPVRTLTVAFAAKGKLLLASTEWRLKVDGLGNKTGGVRAWDLGSKQLKYTIECMGAPFLAVTPSGKTFALNSGSPKTLDITLYDVETGEKTGALSRALGSPVVALSLSPDGKRLAAATEDSVVELWDPSARKLVASLKTAKWRHNLRDLALAPDGKTLAVGTEETEGLKLLDLEDEIVLRDSCERWCNGGGRGCLKYSQDGKLLAVARGGTAPSGLQWGVVVLLDPWVGRRKSVTGNHACGPIHCIAFSPDGKWLALAGGEEQVGLWKIDDE